jgi:probable rRNA maturation factor
MAPSIYVRNLQRKYPVNRTGLQSFAEQALEACGLVSQGKGIHSELPDEIFVLLISDARMARLHEKFLNESGPTDVITFQHGEILVSVETAYRQARQFRSTLLQEIRLYIVHGLLHLHGFNDTTQPDRRQMRAAETAVFRRVRGLK